MSTKRREYEYGRIVSVDIVPLGDNLAADVSAGASSITVEDAADFDEDGGLLLLAGTVYAYTTWAEDESTGVGTITLSGTLGAVASEGDEVAVYDPMYATAASDKVCQVEMVGDDGNVDMLEAALAMHLSDKLEEGVRGLNGEQVKLEIEGDEWRIVDILGLGDRSGGSGQASGVLAEQDQTTVTTAGVPTQSIILKHTPILNSEHGYWNGVYQQGSEWTRYGQVMVFPDPDGLMKVGDELTCEYLYTPGTDFSDPGSGIELIGAVWYDLDVASFPGTGFDLALPAGTQEGDMLCLIASSWVEPASSPDARFFMSSTVPDDTVPGGDLTRTCLVAIGREDGSGDDVHVQLGETTWRGVGIVAFRGVTIASATSFFEIGSEGTIPDPPSPATRYIAVTATISGTVGDNITMPALPAGAWSTALRERAGKAAAMVCYTPDSAPEVAALAAGIEFAAGVGGSTGYCQWIVLGVR